MTVHSPGSVLNYFAEGNTARGSVNLFDSSLQDLERVYILKGGPGSGKSSLIRSLGSGLREKGYAIWQLHCARDNDSLDGVIVPELKVGIVDGTAPHVVEPRLPGAVEEYVNLGVAWDAAKLRGRKTEIARLQEQIQQALDRAYAGFAEALRIHDEWEAIYIENLDVQAADRLIEQYRHLLYGEQRMDKQSRVDRRFLGAATPKGAVDFVPNLTEGVRKRYLIKGRPGSGKSTLLKQLAKTATERGFDVEIYHCGFDPHSVDMIIVRELGFALFDSTAPHEYVPERPHDEIIDMYERCIRPGTDETHAAALEQIRARYAAKMKQAIACLAEANAFHRELENIYGQAMDFAIVEEIKHKLCREIFAFAESCG
ncbi:PRK06851 family protein [Brevibacillus marinus]|uniref:PRK06851 family protein n=1 Tax=Brevibacillus marinus TaxID=2496837 RepID=UPI001F494EB4|nr:PRK06851 family protein [Brevibacillus marinus]